MSEIELFNLQENALVTSPCLIIHGKCSKQNGSKNIQVQHPALPTLNFPVIDNFFKATIILNPGSNRLTFVTDTNISKVVTCIYSPQYQNLPIHLCLLVANDSPLEFDSPRSQKDKEGGNNLDLAIRKLRIGGRLMQAFTNEQMLRNGFGHRTFQFVEEYTWDTQFQTRQQMRNTIKIHILRSDKSTKEIRDYDIAQQNPKAKDGGGLFGVAMDALKKYGGPFTNSDKPVQAAVMFLDTHWDGKLITGHAALGGGTSDIKLAIFGSHGLYSWPPSMEQLIPYMLDSTEASTKEVANDCNECGTHWECLVVTLGAFMHEIGHLLGCPHQENGVMLRDYTRLNRSFLTQEAFSVRTKSYGAKPPIYPKEECGWHRLDMLRFLYHPSFTLPEDYYDPSFMRPTRLNNPGIAEPSLYPLGNGTCTINSEGGIYCVEIVCGDLARAYIEYIPKSLGGQGPQHKLTLSIQDIRSRIPPDHLAKHGNDFKISLLVANGPGKTFDNFPNQMNISTIPMDRYGFGKNVHGIKSTMLGGGNRGSEIDIIPLDIANIVAVRIYHGGALDGIRFYQKRQDPNKPPTIPSRTYAGKLTNSMKDLAIKEADNNVLFGKETRNYSDVIMEPGEIITGFNVRCGAWIDAVQLITSYGRITQMFGNANGGGLGKLIAPEGKYILGLYGRMSNWVDAMGIVYG
ncbi:hypothetical protein Kpol_1003p23 [Vanderwaltozyma polyspora DSM 70294]|uniref:Jacalin-type lectin domain-containing protein n=1 Tax=Vanderwaltozyma polyspora (strain ATCC 22028 / DSM 70294 / BCRC 21397 / CBS 2163 / NBRC 10782 / NRRL Y-8283 / UCD 57-17) TaxID=436907 RepID=A7TLY1_VANPO|nr:uncharacterized protein Kpol_1003p23 [Vanderwaltozyma polyspora DSM 70294]EDO16718.1 hypothetical protein Kpol_1003p23 [Vanderwaltozyma polyspora DSM 70294]